MRRLVIAAAILLIQGRPAEALLLWNWSYSGTGVSASGTLTTNDAPDGAGFYQIVGITGDDNGVTITGLQPTGTAIPGNEPYAVDNLVSAAEPHLTTHGFGFSLANGNCANPFFKGSIYYEYLSVPPYVNGAGPEKPVSFSAAIVRSPAQHHTCLRASSALLASPKSFAPRRTAIEASSTGLAGCKGPDTVSTAAMTGGQPRSNHVLRCQRPAVRQAAQDNRSLFNVGAVTLRAERAGACLV